jgi:hypothetical protein
MDSRYKYTFNEPEALREEFAKSLPQEEADALAKKLRAEGFKQTSNKFRHVARLPPGKTGLEALAELEPEYVRALQQRVEDQAAEHYLRVYAARAGLEQTLDLRTFQAFKRAGGR